MDTDKLIQNGIDRENFMNKVILRIRQSNASLSDFLNQCRTTETTLIDEENLKISGYYIDNCLIISINDKIHELEEGLVTESDFIEKLEYTF